MIIPHKNAENELRKLSFDEYLIYKIFRRQKPSEEKEGFWFTLILLPASFMRI